MLPVHHPIGNNFKDELRFLLPKFRTNFFHSVLIIIIICIFIGFPAMQHTKNSFEAEMDISAYPLNWLKQEQRGPQHNIMETIEFHQIRTNWNPSLPGVSSANVSNEMIAEKIIINGFVRDSQHDRLMMIRLLRRFLLLAWSCLLLSVGFGHCCGVSVAVPVLGNAVTSITH